MLITTTKTVNGTEFLYNYSNAGYYIEQDGTGFLYEEAYDQIDSNRTYTESSEKIDGQEDGINEYEQLGRILMGDE